MRPLFLIAAIALLAACSSQAVVHHSPYDLNRDGVLDARCPGLEYDTSENTLYEWRSEASGDCADDVPLKESQEEQS